MLLRFRKRVTAIVSSVSASTSLDEDDTATDFDLDGALAKDDQVAQEEEKEEFNKTVEEFKRTWRRKPRAAKKIKLDGEAKAKKLDPKEVLEVVFRDSSDDSSSDGYFDAGSESEKENGKSSTNKGGMLRPSDVSDEDDDEDDDDEVDRSESSLKTLPSLDNTSESVNNNDDDDFVKGTPKGKSGLRHKPKSSLRLRSKD